jgi:hypothetical protein
LHLLIGRNETNVDPSVKGGRNPLSDVIFLYNNPGYIVGDEPGIPTVSEWGSVAMALLVLTAGILVLAPRRNVSRVAG